MIWSGGRGSRLTAAVPVSHFLGFRNPRKYGRTVSLPARTVRRHGSPTFSKIELRYDFLERWAGIEPAYNGFADRRVNQLRHHRIHRKFTVIIILPEKTKTANPFLLLTRLYVVDSFHQGQD